MRRIKLYNEETEKGRLIFSSVVNEIVQRRYPPARLLGPSDKELENSGVTYEGTERIAITDEGWLYFRTYLAISTSPESGINRRLSRIASVSKNLGREPRLSRAILALATECPRLCLAKADELGETLGNQGIQFELWEAKDVRQQIAVYLNTKCPAFHNSHLEQLASRIAPHKQIQLTSSSSYHGSKDAREDDSPEQVGVLFVSHASEDTEFVDRLVAILDKVALRVWYDKREIFVGDSIVAKINEGLSDSKAVIVVLSKASVKKQWVLQEIAASLTVHLSSGRMRVLPVLIEQCDIPPLLAGIKYADFRFSFDRGMNELVAGLQGRRQSFI